MAAAVATCVVLVSCASSTTLQPSAISGSSGSPVGLIAMGHSMLTGENSDPSKPGQEAKENSWATGTSPAVESIYQRMVALLPQTKGHVTNTARGGAPASALADQARQALAAVPNPRLAIIETIDDDITCGGNLAAHLMEFGASVTAGLRVITQASPQTRILIITQPGRPSLEVKGMAPLIASNPKVKAMYTGPPPCGMYDPTTGKLVPKHVAHLTAIIAAYEAEQARVCRQFPTCHTDGGGLASFKREPSVLSSDYNHLNTRGLARLARMVWPYARAVLASDIGPTSS
jgi:hypothetical protein